MYPLQSTLCYFRVDMSWGRVIYLSIYERYIRALFKTFNILVQILKHILLKYISAHCIVVTHFSCTFFHILLWHIFAPDLLVPAAVASYCSTGSANCAEVLQNKVLWGDHSLATWAGSLAWRGYAHSLASYVGTLTLSLCGDDRSLYVGMWKSCIRCVCCMSCARFIFHFVSWAEQEKSTDLTWCRSLNNVDPRVVKTSSHI